MYTTIISYENGLQYETEHADYEEACYWLAAHPETGQRLFLKGEEQYDFTEDVLAIIEAAQ